MKKFYFLFLGIAFLACSQEKKVETKKQEISYDINKYIFPETKDITENNFVEKLNSEINHYNHEPIYYFRIQKQNCLIEINVNDVISYDDYELSNTITPVEIGNILISGKQKVTVKMYPVGNLINEDLGRENVPPATILSNNAEVEVEVIMIDNKSKKSFDDEKSIVKKVSPTEAAGKEYFEFSFTFDANVPYEFEGWTKGQDLTKLDQVLVQKKALEFYKMVGEIYVNKDLNSRLKLDYPSNVRFMSTYFVDNNYLVELLDEYRHDAISRDYIQKPIEDYNFNYMGNGKLLSLVTNSLDPDLRGGSALKLTYGQNGVSLPGITLYLPEGRDLATQGFMMWK